jgi:hypothetical protein
MASWCIEIGQTFREHEFANVILLKRNSSWLVDFLWGLDFQIWPFQNQIASFFWWWEPEYLLFSPPNKVWNMDLDQWKEVWKLDNFNFLHFIYIYVLIDLFFVFLHSTDVSPCLLMQCSRHDIRGVHNSVFEFRSCLKILPVA